MCTASAAKLQEHVDSKHSKNGFAVSAKLLCSVVNLLNVISFGCECRHVSQKPLPNDNVAILGS